MRNLENSKPLILKTIALLTEFSFLLKDKLGEDRSVRILPSLTSPHLRGTHVGSKESRRSDDASPSEFKKSRIHPY